MTVIIPESVTCTICDCISEQPILNSTNTFFGELDLDARPPEMMRSTMDTWVQKCPQCGYCYPDIARGKAEHKSVISSPEYAGQLQSGEYPELANAFLCLALIYISENEPVHAGKQYHHAAWVCDDNELSDRAVACRIKAVRRFEIAIERGESLTPGPQIEERELENLMMADLCRRVGWFKRALHYCQEGINRTGNEEYLSYYSLEKELIQATDTQSHSIHPEQKQ